MSTNSIPREATDPDAREGFFAPTGLHFSCTSCGACCRGAPGIVPVSPEEAHALAEYLSISLEEAVHRFLAERDGALVATERPDGSCIFLEHDRCLIHAVKPGACWRYPFWVRILRSRECWENESRHCPGIGQGRHHTPAEILACLHEELADRPDVPPAIP